MSVDIASFATTQLSLLAAELAAEVSESTALTSSLPPAALQRAGAAIINLTVSSSRTGFGGKTVLELEPDAATGGQMPEHGLRVGDIVKVMEMTSGSAKKRERDESEKKGVSGVVSRIMEIKIAIALDKEEADVPTTGRLWMYVGGAWADPRWLISFIESSWLMILHINGLPPSLTLMLKSH